MEMEERTKRIVDLELKLTDKDVKKLFEKIGDKGITVEELFENVIADLIDGCGTNGSDERMYMEQWFSRAAISFSRKNFVRYLIERCGYDVEKYLNDYLEYENRLDSQREELKLQEKEFEENKKSGNWKDIGYWTDKSAYKVYDSEEEWEKQEKKLIEAGAFIQEYNSEKEWEKAALGDIEEIREDIEAMEEYLKEVHEDWKKYLEWAECEEENLTFEDGIEELKEWVEMQNQFLEEDCEL